MSGFLFGTSTTGPFISDSSAWFAATPIGQAAPRGAWKHIPRLAKLCTVMVYQRRSMEDDSQPDGTARGLGHARLAAFVAPFVRTMSARQGKYNGMLLGFSSNGEQDGTKEKLHMRDALYRQILELSQELGLAREDIVTAEEFNWAFGVLDSTRPAARKQTQSATRPVHQGSSLPFAHAIAAASHTGKMTPAIAAIGRQGLILSKL